jgi:UV DNA damage endonuclease
MPPAKPRLGLCCLFLDEAEVRFRTTTVRALSGLKPGEARRKQKELAHANAEALLAAVRACDRLSIRAFRVMSGLLPVATHPDFRLQVAELPAATIELYRAAGAEAARAGVRLSFHPDQFVLLGSPNPATTRASLRDLRVQGDLAELLGADCINLHAGGGYGDKATALERVARTLARLPDNVRTRLTLENDDRVFHVRDLAPFCRREGIPLTYDVHHHRCMPDGLSVAEATALALATWDREPLFHVSSPKAGWSGGDPRPHADYIDPADFPAEWRGLKLTVDVEAKAKERAVLDLQARLAAPSPERAARNPPAART